MSSISASGTIYIRNNGGTEYSTDNTNWIPITSWPVTINNTDSPNTTLKVLFTTDITLTANDQYFDCGTSYIQFGDTSLKGDGTRPTITISSVTDYPGLVKNNGNSNVSIVNLIVDGSTSTLSTGGGWIAQSDFASAATSTDNYIVNCSSIGPIVYTGGGIIGKNSANNGGGLNITGCSSSGQIGIQGGGITGAFCGQDTDSILTIDQCFSTDAIEDSAGGICGSLCGSFSGIVNVSKCYSTGSIGALGGGIFGSACGTQGTATADSSYSTGNINQYGGGIFGEGAGGVSSGSALATNCYSTGSINDSGGIFGKDFLVFYSIATNCYTSGIINSGIGGGIYYGNIFPGPSNYSETTGIWSDVNANSTLQNIGTTWASISPNTPYILLSFGASPYTLNNINQLNYSLINSYTYPTAVIAGNSTSGVPTSGYKSFQILSGGHATITIDASGVISTTVATPPATYTLSIYGVDDYTTTILILDVSPPPPTPIPMPTTIPPCCEANILAKNPQVTSYDSDVVVSKKAGKTIDRSVDDYKAGVISGIRMGNWRPVFTSYSSYMLFLQGKMR